MNKRLKPLEHLQTTPTEFRDLCYLLSCKSIQEVASFKNWEGVTAAREHLAEQFQNIVHFESSTTTTGGGGNGNNGGGGGGGNGDDGSSVYVPPARMLHLLQQATAYQIESSRYHPRIAPRIHTLLHDYQCFVIPNDCRRTMVGHRGNVKCLEWVGDEGRMIASGSSDNTVRLWNVDDDDTTGTGRHHAVGVLTGHNSRIWDITSNRSGSVVASGSGDGTVKVGGATFHGCSSHSHSHSRHHHITITTTLPLPPPRQLWDVRDTAKCACAATLRGHQGDIYSLQYHPGEQHIVTGGYDKVVRLFDVQKETVVKAFAGHQLSISTCRFNPIGNLIVTG